MALSLQPTTGQRKPYQRGLGMPQQPGQQPSIFGQAKPLQAPQPLTQAGGLAQQQNAKSLQTGQFGDVQSAQAATNRAAALKQYQAIQLSRANAVRGNLSAEQAQRGQDQALASANSQNLTAQNSVNAMQRQYGQDALNRADTYEADAYGKATAERGYQDSRGDLAYNRATDEARYGDSRGDTAFNQNLQTQQFGANRQDAAFSQGLAKDQFAANRDDTMYSRGYQQSRDAVGDARYGQEYADSRGDVQYARGRDAIGDQRYDQQYSDSRADLGYNRATDEARYGDTRADVKYGQQYQASRDQVGDQRYDAATAYSQGRDAVGDQRYNQSYQDSRADLGYDRATDQARYGDTRADVAYGQQYQASRDAVGDTRYDQAYADQRGDVQYQRGYQENRDSVGDMRYNNETAYNQGRDAIGDQRYDASTQYQQSRDAVGDARYDQSTQYQQSRDALGDTRYDQAYADQRSDSLYNRTEAQRLEGKGDINTLISSIQDPRAQNLLRNVQAQGGDVQAMYNTMLDNGTIKEEYRSSSPGELSAQAKIDELKSFYPNKTDAEIQQMALAEREQERAATQKPLADATKSAAAEQAAADLAAGKVTPESLATLQPVNPQSIPLGGGVREWLANNQTGGWVNLSGTKYQVVGGSNNMSGDYAIIKDETGQTRYLTKDGRIGTKLQQMPFGMTVVV